MEKTDLYMLKFWPQAWAKAKLIMEEALPNEVSMMGISEEGNPLVVQDVVVLKQECSGASTDIDDAAMADYIDDMCDKGVPPNRCGRIWIHTHPKMGTSPSSTDEGTLRDVFGACNWTVMMIMSDKHDPYARLRLSVGGMILSAEIKVGLEYSKILSEAEQERVKADVKDKVSTKIHTIGFQGSQGKAWNNWGNWNHTDVEETQEEKEEWPKGISPMGNMWWTGIKWRNCTNQKDAITYKGDVVYNLDKMPATQTITGEDSFYPFLKDNNANGSVLLYRKTDSKQLYTPDERREEKKGTSIGNEEVESDIDAGDMEEVYTALLECDYQNFSAEQRAERVDTTITEQEFIAAVRACLPDVDLGEGDWRHITPESLSDYILGSTKEGAHRTYQHWKTMLKERVISGRILAGTARNALIIAPFLIRQECCLVPIVHGKDGIVTGYMWWSDDYE